jgi:hypothetical protein
MIVLPIETRCHKDDVLIIVLDGTSVERMKRADPAEVNVRGAANLVNPRVLVCLEEPSAEFMCLVNGRDVRAILRHLSRGFEFRPDLGDHDDGPKPINIF